MDMFKSIVIRPAIVAAPLLIALVLSCAEDTDAPDKTSLLVGKMWVATASEMDGEDITDEMDPCETDNATIFFSDGTFKEEMGSELCEEFETDREGIWVFKSNQSMLSFQPSGEPVSDWKIDELTESRLKISQYVPMFKARVAVVMEPNSN